MKIGAKIVKREFFMLLKSLLIAFVFWVLLIPYNLYVDFHNKELERKINTSNAKIEKLEKSFESPISIITRINYQIYFFEKWNENKKLPSYKDHIELWSKLKLASKNGNIESQFNSNELSIHLKANGIEKLNDYISLIKINTITDKEYRISEEIYNLGEVKIELAKKQKFKLDNKFEFNYKTENNKLYNKLGITFCFFLIILVICFPFRFIISLIKKIFIKR